MTYTVPPKPAEPKPRYVRVSDPAEIEAIKRSGLRDPIGYCHMLQDQNGAIEEACWAEAHSLAQFRGHPVEFVV